VDTPVSAALQQARARRGIRRMGMLICEGRTASSLAGAEGATRRRSSLGRCAPLQRLHGHRNESSGEIVVVTQPLYSRRVFRE
jgi:hypothetical protein